MSTVKSTVIYEPFPKLKRRPKWGQVGGTNDRKI